MKRLITKSDLAKEAGVSRPTVSGLCKRGLKAALVGKLINADHPSVIDYLKSKHKDKMITGIKKKKTDPGTKKKTGKGEANHYSKDHDIVGFLDFTIREILEQFGTDVGFRHYVESVKIIGDIQHKHLKTEELKGNLISRDMVKMHIFGAIENSNLRLLGDVPKTLARRLFAMVKSGGTVEEAEALARELIGMQLKSLKTTAKRKLKRVKR